jgi:hypothetical protein
VRTGRERKGSEGQGDGKFQFHPFIFRALIHFSSWPGLSRPSTFLLQLPLSDVDARDKPGHDELCG